MPVGERSEAASAKLCVRRPAVTTDARYALSLPALVIPDAKLTKWSRALRDREPELIRGSHGEGVVITVDVAHDLVAAELVRE
jgi:hypothetical protein